MAQWVRLLITTSPIADYNRGGAWDPVEQILHLNGATDAPSPVKLEMRTVELNPDGSVPFDPPLFVPAGHLLSVSCEYLAEAPSPSPSEVPDA